MKGGSEPKILDIKNKGTNKKTMKKEKCYAESKK